MFEVFVASLPLLFIACYAQLKASEDIDRLKVFWVAILVSPLFYIGAGATVYATQAFGVVVTLELLLIVSAASGILLCMLILTLINPYRIASSFPSVPDPNGRSNAFSALPIISVLTLGLCTLMFGHALMGELPAFGWDVIGKWSKTGHAFYSSGIISAFGSGPEPVFEYEPRHPLLINYTVAVAEIFGTQINLMSVAYSLWIMLAVVISITMFFLAASLSGSYTTGLIASYVLASTPLFENHYQIYGYLEMWIVYVVLLTIVVAKICLDAPTIGRSAVLFIFLILLMSIKYLSIVYTLIFIFSLVLASMLRRVAILKRHNVFLACTPCLLAVSFYLIYAPEEGAHLLSLGKAVFSHQTFSLMATAVCVVSFFWGKANSVSNPGLLMCANDTPDLPIICLFVVSSICAVAIGYAYVGSLSGGQLSTVFTSAPRILLISVVPALVLIVWHVGVVTRTLEISNSIQD